MRILNLLLENQEFSNYMDDNFEESYDFLKYYFDINEIDNFIINNLQLFQVENDLNATYDNIKEFSRCYTESLLYTALQKSGSFMNRMGTVTGFGKLNPVLGSGRVIGLNFGGAMAAGAVGTAVGGEKAGEIASLSAETVLGVVDASAALMTTTGSGGSLAAGAATAVGTAGAGAIITTAMAGGFLGYNIGTILNKVPGVSQSAGWVMDHGLGKIFDTASNLPKFAMSMFGNDPIKVVENAKLNNVHGVVSSASNSKGLENTRFFESGVFTGFIKYVGSKFESMGSEVGLVWNNLLTIAQNQPQYLYGPILLLGVIGIIIKYKFKPQKLRKH